MELEVKEQKFQVKEIKTRIKILHNYSLQME